MKVFGFFFREKVALNFLRAVHLGLHVFDFTFGDFVYCHCFIQGRFMNALLGIWAFGQCEAFSSGVIIRISNSGWRGALRVNNFAFDHFTEFDVIFEDQGL